MTTALAEIDRIRTQPEAVQGIAKDLIATFPASVFRTRRLDFLESIVQFRNVAEFTRRQVEWLLIMRDGLEEDGCLRIQRPPLLERGNQS